MRFSSRKKIPLDGIVQDRGASQHEIYKGELLAAYSALQQINGRVRHFPDGYAGGCDGGGDEGGDMRSLAAENGNVGGNLQAGFVDGPVNGKNHVVAYADNGVGRIGQPQDFLRLVIAGLHIPVAISDIVWVNGKAVLPHAEFVAAVASGRFNAAVRQAGPSDKGNFPAPVLCQQGYARLRALLLIIGDVVDIRHAAADADGTGRQRAHPAIDRLRRVAHKHESRRVLPGEGGKIPLAFDVVFRGGECEIHIVLHEASLQLAQLMLIGQHDLSAAGVGCDEAPDFLFVWVFFRARVLFDADIGHVIELFHSPAYLPPGFLLDAEGGVIG